VISEERRALYSGAKFFKIDDLLYLMRPNKNLMQVPWEIFQIEMYELPIPPNGVENSEEYIRIRAVMAIYDPKILYNSLIRFQDITFANSTEPG
jgi:hypothetical protein